MTQDRAYISEKVIPAIMPKNFEHLKSEIRRFVSLVPLVQIDVMDGKFTPAKSWPYQSVMDGDFLKIVNQEEGFPSWEDVDFEADLMVSNPAEAADQWVAAGAARIIIHLECAAPDIITSVLSTIKDKGIETGLAVGLETSPEVLADFYEKNKDIIDIVQFMGIAQIGFQGQSFDERVIDNISKFREHFPEVVISIDGGVNDQTVSRLAEAGASRLVAGSALGEGHNIEQTIEQFDDFLKIP